MFALANNASLDAPVHSTTQEDVKICDKLNGFLYELYIVPFTRVACSSYEVHIYDNN